MSTEAKTKGKVYTVEEVQEMVQEAADRSAAKVREHLQEKREQERHEMAMRVEQKKLDDNSSALLAAGLAQLMGTADQFLKVLLVRQEFGKPADIKASACNLIKQAAVMKGTPEALEEAANKLLDLCKP
jgi:hypothetical protein